LERSVLELLLASLVTQPGAVSPVIVDGMLGYAALRSDQVDTATLNIALAELSSQDQLISLVDLLSGPTRESASLYFQAVTSFVTFLLKTYSPQQMKRFAQQLDSTNAEATSQSVYGMPLLALEKRWLAEVEKAQAGVMGVMGFVRRSFSWMRPHWRMQAGVLLTMMVGLAFTTILPLSYRFLIDRAILPGDRLVLAVIIAVLGGLFVINALAALLGDYVGARLSTRVMNDMRLAMFTHLQRLSLGFHSRAQVGDLI